MRTSKLVRSILVYLPLLTVTVAAGIFIAKDLHQKSLTSRLETPPQLMIIPEEMGTCMLSNVYLSLPPKCKTLDGNFIQLPGSSSNVFVNPPVK